MAFWGIFGSKKKKEQETAAPQAESAAATDACPSGAPATDAENAVNTEAETTANTAPVPDTAEEEAIAKEAAERLDKG